MKQNLCEFLRESSISELFKIKSFKNSWPVWNFKIHEFLPEINAVNIVNLGDHLSDIFKTTSFPGRTQSSVSGGGVSWEALVCWYLNICLIGSRTIVIKQKKKLIPTAITEALRVSYGNFASNTESDLIAITFPEKLDYTTNDKFDIEVYDIRGEKINTKKTNHKFNYKEIIDALLIHDFSECEISVIQCKTNWNDNAQIPMLWDMVYASDGFYRRNISVGSSMYSIRNIKFTYSFVTVPTNKKSKYTPNSTSVKRVCNISGGNYWGKPTESGVANSLKDIFSRNFSSGSSDGIRITLTKTLPELSNKYSYFQLY